MNYCFSPNSWKRVLSTALTPLLCTLLAPLAQGELTDELFSSTGGFVQEDGQPVFKYQPSASWQGAGAVLEWSTDLQNWQFEDVLSAPDLATATRRVIAPGVDGNEPVFFRFKMEEFDGVSAGLSNRSMPSFVSTPRYVNNPSHNHPYARDPNFPMLTDPAGDRNLTVEVLENEYLRVEVIPELAGAVYRVFHKPSGSDVFFHEGRIKDWLPFWESGVKVSFPWHEHGVGVNQPASWHRVNHADGSVSIEMWMEFSRHRAAYNEKMFGRFSNLMLSQTVRLSPGEALVQVKYRASNPAAYGQGVRIWNDAFFPREQRNGLPVQANERPYDIATTTKLIFPAAKVSDHDGNLFRDMSEAEKDISYFNVADHNSIFAWNVQDGFSGVWYPQARINRLRLNDPISAPGLKMYVQKERNFASWDSAAHFSHMYNFIELWGGTDNVFEAPEGWVEPGETREIEYFYGMTEAIGEVHYATRHVAVHILESEGPAVVELYAFRDREAVVVEWDNSWTSLPVSVGPLSVQRIELPESGTVTGRLRVLDGAEELLAFDWPLVPVVDAVANQYTLTSMVNASATAAVKERIGNSQLRGNNIRNALSAYPVGSVGRGRVQLRLGQVTNAITTLTSATTSLPQDGEAWHLLGVARLQNNEPALADAALAQAVSVSQAYAPAYYFQALRSINGGQLSQAVAQLDTLLIARPGHWEAKLLRAGLLERSADPLAVTYARSLLEEDPADPRLWLILSRAETGAEQVEAEAIYQSLISEPGAPRRVQEFTSVLDSGIYLPPLRV